MFTYIAIGLAVVFYLTIGVFIGALGWSLWEKKVPTKTTFLLFPVSHVTNTLGVSEWHVILHERMSRGEFLFWVSIAWPITIIWFPLATSSMVVIVILAKAVFLPIGWAIAQMVRFASKFADWVAEPKSEQKTQRLIVTPAQPIKHRVELVETRDRLEAQYQQAVAELEEFEREQALVRGHQAYRLDPGKGC